MPIRADSGTEYSFDFGKFIDPLNDVYCSNSFTQYLEDWKSLLYKLNREAWKEYAFFESRFSPDGNSPEVYQFVHESGNGENSYVYNFNIEDILLRISEEKPHKSLGLTWLISKTASYDSSIILDDRGVKSDPIVLCKFLLPNAFFLVVDGNTRLNYCIENHKLFIKYYLYEIKHKEDFLFSVDWAMYNFVNEVNMICQDHWNKKKMEANIQRSRIFNSSFLAEANRVYGSE